MRIAIIGAGAAGLTAAYHLSELGHQVVVYEASAQPGGLASGFRDERWEWSLERFYHHWFTSDNAIIDLIGELGVWEKLFYRRPITSIWYRDRAYPFDSYLRALTFPHLSLFDKLRAGPVAIYLRLLRDWPRLERYTAHEWLTRWMGRRGYQVLWEPLLVGKFGEYYREVNMAWFWARIHKRSSWLGYFEGGFQGLLDVLTTRVRQRGAEVRLKAPVERIEAEVLPGGPGLAAGHLTVRARGASASYDRVIVTLSPDLLARLVPQLPADYLAGLKTLRSMGAVVAILALTQPLTDGHYWINLPKGEGFPFLALVEHTNFISREHYGGDHLIYCGDYLKPDHEYFSLADDELVARFLPALSRFNPDFRPEWVRRYWVFREKYAQPVPGVNHSCNIPDLATPIKGLFWASMSQVYPWDRGTNYAVEMGREVARRALEV